MTDDLVKRLRSGDCLENQIEAYDLTTEAANRIEELEAALREIETVELDPRNSGQMWVEALKQIARAALKGNRDD